MEEVYSSLPVHLPEVNPALQTLYHDWLQGQDSPQANILLHTQYKSQIQSQSQPPHMQWWEEMESWTWTLNGWFCWKHFVKPSFVKDKLQLTTRGRLSTQTLLSLCQTWNWGPMNPEKHNLTYYADWKTWIEHVYFAILKKGEARCNTLYFVYIFRTIIYFVNDWSRGTEPMFALVYLMNATCVQSNTGC